MAFMKIISATVAGGVLGYLWHRLVGCSSGACPIVRNRYLSIVWGALLGFLFTINR